MAQRLKTDWILFLTTVAMISLGLIILYSASSVMAELRYGSAWHFVLRQFLWTAGGVMVMMVLKRTHYRKFQNPGVAFTGVGLTLILLVLVFFLDSANHRWIRVGPLGIQPSELAKPALAIFLAFFVTWRAPAINTRYTLGPAALAVGLIILAVAEADLGTAVVLGVAAAVVFLVAGLDWRYFAIVGVCGLIGVTFFVVSKPYRVARIIGYVDPEYKLVSRLDSQGRLKSYLQRSLTSRDTSYQVEQSKIAVGAGGPLGLGLMQGRQKLLYLPEAHTDFIYAVVSEELGLLGSVGVLGAFVLIFWRGLRASVLMADDFGRFLALGLTTMIVFQAFMNMSVVLGMIPNKGIPLPMISAGGSSLLSTLTSLGILMNISEHAG